MTPAPFSLFSVGGRPFFSLVTSYTTTKQKSALTKSPTL
jgi:hypothetical protein